MESAPDELLTCPGVGCRIQMLSNNAVSGRTILLSDGLTICLNEKVLVITTTPFAGYFISEAGLSGAYRIWGALCSQCCVFTDARLQTLSTLQLGRSLTKKCNSQQSSLSGREGGPCPRLKVPNH